MSKTTQTFFFILVVLNLILGIIVADNHIQKMKGARFTHANGCEFCVLDDTIEFCKGCYQ